MKRIIFLTILFQLISIVVYSQEFITVATEANGQQISLAANQVLQVTLPSTPSSGYAWYLKSINHTLKQVGDFEFVRNGTEQHIGTSVTQLIRFISTAAGSIDLELIYTRPWEDNIKPLQIYKINVLSEGSYNGNYQPEKALGTDETFYSKNPNLPAAFNLQSKCTPIKNITCGASWAEAACGSFEAVIRIKDGKIRDLSEQWLINCDTKAQGCSGGHCPDYMFEKYGAVYEENAPFKGLNDSCKAIYPYKEKIEGYREIANNVDSIKHAIYNYGPVWSTVYAGQKFQAYRGGVLTEGDQGAVNHAVVLCGWNDSTSSWVLRNCWGTAWGESGYMRIKYGICGVGQYTTFLNYKGGIHSKISNYKQHGDFTVYPNPSFNGKFTIDNLEGEHTIEIYDNVGKLVYKTVAAVITLDLSTYKKGLYLYRITNAANVCQQGKIIYHP